MTQKDKFIKVIEDLGYKVGILHEEVNFLTDRQFKKIVSNLNEETYTYKMFINGVKMLIESESVFFDENTIEKDITIKHLHYYN